MKKRKRPNPIAKELLVSGKYAMRIVKSKKKYSRKEKHKKGPGIQNSGPFFIEFPYSPSLIKPCLTTYVTFLGG